VLVRHSLGGKEIKEIKNICVGKTQIYFLLNYLLCPPVAIFNIKSSTPTTTAIGTTIEKIVANPAGNPDRFANVSADDNRVGKNATARLKTIINPTKVITIEFVSLEISMFVFPP
jgi:hypothetical protein